MSNFTFIYPQWLLGLLPIALLIIWLMRRRSGTSLIAPHLAHALGIEKRDSSKLLLGITLTWTLTIISLAGPSFGQRILPSMGSNNARVLVMDMSRSMYATDLKPNRLTQARYKVSDLLNQWKEGYTGLVAYAGDAYTVSPMTSDTATISALLPSLSPKIMPYLGADASRGVAKAIELMKNAGFAAGSIVLICDDLDSNEAQNIADLLQDSDWKLVILGMGSRVGAPVPLDDGSLLKSNNGQTIIAKSNFDQMAQLADQISGMFVPVQADNRDIDAIVKAAKSSLMSITQGKTANVTDRTNNGYWLIPIVLIAALGLFRRGFIFVFIACSLSLSLPNSVQASPWMNNDQQAKALYDAKNYKAAAEQFKNPEWRGSAQYQAGDYKSAIESFSSIKTPNTRQKYNLANAYAKNGELKKAEQLYQSVLAEQSNNKDAQHNLNEVKKALAKQQQQQQQKNSKNNQNNKHDENKKNQSQSSQNDQSNDQQNGNSGQHQQGSDKKQQNANPSKSESPQDDQSQNDSTRNQPSKTDKQHQNKVNNKPSNSTAQPSTSKDKTMKGEKAQQSMSQADDKGTNTLAQQSENGQAADPELRKLEQVENARDPSRLLHAQLLLQAQQQEPPKDTGKSW